MKKYVKKGEEEKLLLNQQIQMIKRKLQQMVLIKQEHPILIKQIQLDLNLLLLQQVISLV